MTAEQDNDLLAAMVKDCNYAVDRLAREFHEALAENQSIVATLRQECADALAEYDMEIEAARLAYEAALKKARKAVEARIDLAVEAASRRAKRVELQFELLRKGYEDRLSAGATQLRVVEYALSEAQAEVKRSVATAATPAPLP